MPLSVIGEMRDVQPFFESGAVSIHRPKAIRFKQGVLSPGAYIDNRMLQSHPVEWDEVLHKLAERAESLVHDYEAVVSVANGGVPHGVALSREIGIPHFIVNKKVKGHGLGSLIDGDVMMLEGKSVLLIEDMSSTFKSSTRAMEILKAAGARVAHTLLLTTWGLPEFHKNVEEHSVHAICTGEMMVDYAAQSGRLDQGLEKIVRHWLKNPEDESWFEGDWELPEQESE